MEIQNLVLSQNPKAKIEIALEHSFDFSLHNRHLKDINHPAIKEKKIVDGFLNINLDRNYISFDYDTKEKLKIHLEYISPNPTGPLHLGHFRNLCIGASLKEILFYVKHEIFTEMYINDIGNQVNQFVESVIYHQTGKGHLYYHGDYVKNINITPTRENIIAYQLKGIINTLASLNIYFDNIIYESDIVKQTHIIEHILKEKNLIHLGKINNQQSEGMHLIYTTDKEEHVFKRNNGEYTYFANDVTYHFNKFQRKFDKCIVILAEDHEKHMKVMSHIVYTLWNLKVEFVVYNTVLLKQEDKIVTMSKRKGEFLEVEDLIKQCGRNNMICQMLQQRMEKAIYFNFNNTTDNYFYWEFVMQRLNEILNNKQIEKCDLNFVEEKKIFTMLFHWIRFVHIAANQLNPHKFFDFANKFFHIVFEYLHIKHSFTKEELYMLHLCQEVGKRTYQLLNMELKYL